MEKVDKPSISPAKNQILGVFAKQPVPGKVKTRLSPPLSALEAANLYQVALTETLRRLRYHSKQPEYELVICYCGERRWFEDAFPDIPLVLQQGENLGERMGTCLDAWLQNGYERAMLIGSDTPDLPLDYINQAFSALEQAELVIGPATDGGYYLIGERVHQPQLFSQITWSTDAVLKQTLAKAQQANVRHHLLPEWDDLDDLPALQRLLKRSPLSDTAAQAQAVLSGT